MVVMISGQRWSQQAASKTSQVTYWLLDDRIGMRQLTRMMLMRTGQILKGGVVEGAIRPVAMTMTMARVSRPRRVVRKGPGKGRDQRMGQWKGSEKGMEGQMQWRKGTGRGSEIVKGNVLLNKPQGKMISLVPLLCSGRRKCMRQTWTWRAN